MNFELKYEAIRNIISHGYIMVKSLRTRPYTWLLQRPIASHKKKKNCRTSNEIIQLKNIPVLGERISPSSTFPSELNFNRSRPIGANVGYVSVAVWFWILKRCFASIWNDIIQCFCVFRRGAALDNQTWCGRTSDSWSHGNLCRSILRQIETHNNMLL